MNKYSWKEIQKLFAARDLRERAILLGAFSAILFFVWLTYAFDPIQLSQSSFDREITNTVLQINNEIDRNEQVRSTYTSDPDSFARRRLGELQAQVNEIDAQCWIYMESSYCHHRWPMFFLMSCKGKQSCV